MHILRRIFITFAFRYITDPFNTSFEMDETMIFILKGKLNERHVFQAINKWVVPTVWYSTGIIEWTKEEVKKMDRKTKKIITIYGGLYPR